MWSRLFPGRFALFQVFVVIFLLVSFLLRAGFLIWNFDEVNTGLLALLETFALGFLFDLATVSLLSIPYLLYLVLFPGKWFGTLADRIITMLGFFLGLTVIYFSFFGEITFWDEFQRRYNFIAVDYLIYTYEVVQNINESYPLPVLLGSLLSLVGLTFYLIYRSGVFTRVFYNSTTSGQKIRAAMFWLGIAAFSVLFLSNDRADWSGNRYNNELSKAGIYSFFAAFRNNELPYNKFYRTIDDKKAIGHVKGLYEKYGDEMLHPAKNEILRHVRPKGGTSEAMRPNVIFICIESLSAKYLETFGNSISITPTLDSLATHSVFFSNLFATGTRTVRGMEAITLSIPPTPGRSIVKRQDNTGLFTIGEVFREMGYERNFFYGGDGYFDNMNTFFGGNGFNIVDRGRGYLLDETTGTTRINIADEEVTFENAWGVCDADIYNKVLKMADASYDSGKPFFNFVMTTSNHKP